MIIEKNLQELFQQVSETNGRNDKMELVSEHIPTNEMFKQTIIFLCDKNAVTNLASKKMKKSLSDSESIVRIDNYVDFLNYIQSGLTGTDVEVFAIQQYIGTFQDLDIQEFLFKVCTKNLKFGITVSTLNKILKELNLDTVFDLKVQLAETYSKVEKKELVKKPDFLGTFYLTTKLDGVRALAFKLNGKVTFYSRGSKEFLGFDDCKRELEKDIYPDNMVYDGEFLKVNPTNMPSGALYRETMKIVASLGLKKDIVYHMFDIIPVEEFEKGKSSLKYSARRAILDSLETSEYIDVLPVIYIGTDTSMIMKVGMKLIEEGKEGVMVNTDTYYLCKRVKTLLKVKQLLSSDGIIKGVYEGDNKNKGKLGGLTISYYDQEVKVGGGFSDEERELYWNNPELIIGKIGTYEYTEPSENQNGGKDIRFSRWKGLRPDKTAKDVSYDN